MWLLVPWANFQGRFITSSEFCGGVKWVKRTGQDPKAAAERAGGRTAAAGKQMSELLKM